MTEIAIFGPTCTFQFGLGSQVAGYDEIVTPVHPTLLTADYTKFTGTYFGDNREELILKVQIDCPTAVSIEGKIFFDDFLLTPSYT